jgi:hypothetical protein
LRSNETDFPEKETKSGKVEEISKVKLPERKKRKKKGEKKVAAAWMTRLSP